MFSMGNVAPKLHIEVVSGVQHDTDTCGYIQLLLFSHIIAMVAYGVHVCVGAL